MTARITKSPVEATHFVELVFTRDLTPYGVNETEIDDSTVYFVGEPAEWQLMDLVPESWSLLEHHVSPLNKAELEDDEALLAEAYGDFLEDTYDPDMAPGGADFDDWADDMVEVLV